MVHGPSVGAPDDDVVASWAGVVAIARTSHGARRFAKDRGSPAKTMPRHRFPPEVCLIIDCATWKVHFSVPTSNLLQPQREE